MGDAAGSERRRGWGGEGAGEWPEENGAVPEDPLGKSQRGRGAGRGQWVRGGAGPKSP